jgi:hypothetical protein
VKKRRISEEMVRRPHGTKIVFDILINYSVDDDLETRSAPPGAPQGFFGHLPYYVRLYETLNGAFEVDLMHW